MQEFRIRFTAAPQKSIEFCGPDDITAQTTDAIVNAANSHLMGGGGVDGAIHYAGGSSILQECRAYVQKHGKLPAGKAMLTGGGRLAAKFVIHTVGPVYFGGGHGERETLANCYRESIQLAEQQGIHSLSFPAISTGAYGYPLPEAAEVAITSAAEELARAKQVERVRFVLFDSYAVDKYAKAARRFTANTPGFVLEGD